MSRLCLAVLASCVATASAGCMQYSEALCGDCVWNVTAHDCQSFEKVPAGKTDICAGRKVCEQCHWMSGMCMAAGGGGGNSHADTMAMMQMTFYQTERVTILFNDWSTKNTVQYFFSCLAVVVVSAATTLARHFVSMLRAKNDNEGASWGMRVLTAVGYFGVQCLVYGVMLITMTFNSILFFCVMLGLTAGWLLIPSAPSVKSKRKSYTDATEETPLQSGAAICVLSCH